jgi:hypothetical protein
MVGKLVFILEGTAGLFNQAYQKRKARKKQMVQQKTKSRCSHQRQRHNIVCQRFKGHYIHCYL